MDDDVDDDGGGGNAHQLALPDIETVFLQRRKLKHLLAYDLWNDNCPKLVQVEILD